ncbi:unnamed protein product, partial [Heterotrigona itama]
RFPVEEFLRRMDGSVFPDGLTSNDSLMNGQEETARSHLALPRQLGPACKVAPFVGHRRFP